MAANLIAAGGVVALWPTNAPVAAGEAAAPAPGETSSQTGRPLFHDGFDGGLRQWAAVQSARVAAVRVVSFPDGGRGLRCEVRQGDRVWSSETNGGGLTLLTEERDGDERVYAFRLRLDGIPHDDATHVLAKWNPRRDSAAAALALAVERGRIGLRWERTPTGPSLPISAPLRDGSWHEVAVRVQWSRERRGSVALTVDGRDVGRRASIVTLPDGPTYLRVGYTRPAGVAATAAVEYDDVRIVDASATPASRGD